MTSIRKVKDSTQLPNIDDKNFVFLDEVGFSVATRPKRGRSRRGNIAAAIVPATRTRNISVLAAMNKYGMIYQRIHDRVITGEIQYCSKVLGHFQFDYKN